MKTVGELKNFLKSIGGELTIGSLTIKCEGEESDLDILYNGIVQAWFPFPEVDDSADLTSPKIMPRALFDPERDSRFEQDAKNSLESEKSLQKENKKLKEDIEILSNSLSENTNAHGMVIAYEKILLGGKKLTLE